MAVTSDHLEALSEDRIDEIRLEDLERGAVAVEACAVHPVLSGKAIERIEASPLRQLVVTDTIPLSAQKRIDKIHIQSVARLFADAIQAIHDGSSVSRLFR